MAVEYIASSSLLSLHSDFSAVLLYLIGSHSIHLLVRFVPGEIQNIVPCDMEEGTRISFGDRNLEGFKKIIFVGGG